MRILLGLVAVILVCASGDRPAGAETWTLRNAHVEATFRLAADGLLLAGLASPQTGRSIASIEGPDSVVTVNGTTGALGSSEAGWVLVGADTAESDVESRLTFLFRSTRASITAERVYKCYAGSPAIETWTTFRATGSSTVTISNPTVWQAVVPSAILQYEHGLRGDAAGAAVEDAFSLQSQTLGPGDGVTLTERNRSTEQYLPMVAADMREDEFFGGLAWSGAWQIQAQGLAQDRMRISASLPGVSIAVDGGRPLETPHGFFGFTPGNRGDVAAALRGYVMQGLRAGRPFPSLVTSNTWFAYGTDLDEESVKNEMANAALNGVELFVVDAGWYLGAGKGGDFDTGLGTWRVDPARFPEGLGALSDYAHGLGLRFGLWVEPERVDQSTVGRSGLAQPAWLASNGGNLGSSKNAQICLASAAARQWVLDRLFELIDSARPDYLKWDNNFWLNCNRAGHGHGTTDGNFAHVNGLYDVLGALRERYPDLQIENCAQGGNRADFGMLRYTDSAWMDDRTGPSAHVRHNLEGLATFFPPAYLLSFAINESAEPLAGGADVSLYLRSRMPGVLGLTYRAADLSESDQGDLAREIALYKSIRDLQRDASARLLSAQAQPDGGPAWDVLQEHNAATGESVLYAFQNDGGTRAVAVQPRNLTAEAVYTISTAEGRVLGSATGQALARDGLTIVESSESAARIYVLRPDRPPPLARSVNRAERDE